MSDIEKQQHHYNDHNGNTNGNNGIPSASNTLTNMPGQHGPWPIGAGPGGQYPYTLGANALQQQLYQGGLINLRKFANPAPLGLLSFASTTLILSLINVSTNGVDTPNVVVGMTLFVGGLVQLLAGMWEFAAGNTLGATAFSSYGGFWLSFGTIYIPASGILDAYTGAAASQLDNALGFYLAVWFIFTFIMFIASLRSNMGLILLFFFLDLTFMFLTISKFVPNVNIAKAGGGFGIIAAFIAFYCGAANMLTYESSFFMLPLAPIPERKAE
ncbi:GPR1/FUN34/yaaH family-domain-containing protein [Phellopilus nigrolimitatus]|nr:GPR1/FUN34/yaaH family-domain-containing protein [Phellopilus nigrolimitatus]